MNLLPPNTIVPIIVKQLQRTIQVVQIAAIVGATGVVVSSAVVAAAAVLRRKERTHDSP